MKRIYNTTRIGKNALGPENKKGQAARHHNHQPPQLTAKENNPSVGGAILTADRKNPKEGNDDKD